MRRLREPVLQFGAWGDPMSHGSWSGHVADFGVVVACARASQLRAVRRRIEQAAWDRVCEARELADALKRYIAALERVLRHDPRKFDAEQVDIIRPLVATMHKDYALALSIARSEARGGNPYTDGAEAKLEGLDDRVLAFMHAVELAAVSKAATGEIELEVEVLEAVPPTHVALPSFRGDGKRSPVVDDDVISFDA